MKDEGDMRVKGEDYRTAVSCSSHSRAQPRSEQTRSYMDMDMDMGACSMGVACRGVSPSLGVSNGIRNRWL